MYWLRLLTCLFVGTIMVLLAVASIFVPIAFAVLNGNAWYGLMYLGTFVWLAFTFLVGESLEDWLHEGNR